MSLLDRLSKEKNDPEDVRRAETTARTGSLFDRLQGPVSVPVAPTPVSAPTAAPRDFYPRDVSLETTLTKITSTKTESFVRELSENFVAPPTKEAIAPTPAPLESRPSAPACPAPPPAPPEPKKEEAPVPAMEIGSKQKVDIKQRYAFLDRVINLHKKMIMEGNLNFSEEQLTSKDPAVQEKLRKDVEKEVMRLLEKEEECTYLSRNEKMELTRAVIDETVGLGPLQKLVDDKSISEIMVNGPFQTYVEYRGKLTLSDILFRDNDHLKRIIDRIVGQVGRRIDESMPMCDARLLDGSRVNAIIPPLALKGPTLTIRKFSSKPLAIEDLIKYSTMTWPMAKFLKACVEGHVNIVVSGGTGSGKTTLLNVLSSFIPPEDRIITVEDSAELQLQQEHVVTLETRPPNSEGKGEVSMRDLIKNTLRMRPERIVVGEVRGGEALDMLQAMNTGHDGSLTTGHANKPRDMVARLETMVMMAGMDMPMKAIRQQIASAIHLIVQQSRLQDGSRKVIEITEVTGMEGDVVTMQPIFRFVQTGLDAARKVVGHFEATGVVPTFYEKLEAKGLDIDRTIFDPYAHLQDR